MRDLVLALKLPRITDFPVGEKPMSSEITVNATQAALIHGALAVAISEATDSLQLKSAQPFRNAINTQIQAYKAEQERLAEAFPELVS